MKNFLKFWPYIRSYKGAFICGIIALFAVDFVDMILPWLWLQILGAVRMALEGLKYPPGSQEAFSLSSFLGYCALTLVMVRLLQACLRFLYRIALQGSNRKAVADLRHDWFSKVLQLSPAQIAHFPTGDLMARATNDMQALMRTTFGVVLIADWIAYMIFVPYAMYTISPTLTLYSVMLLPFLIVAVIYLQKRVHVRFTKTQEQFSSLSAGVQENVSGIKVVKSYCQEEKEIRRLKWICRDYFEKSMRHAGAQGMMVCAFILFIGAEIFIITSLGAREMQSGSLLPEEFAAFILYFFKLPVKNLFKIIYIREILLRVVIRLPHQIMVD